MSRLLPATQSMSVVLPAPLGPSRPTTSPGPDREGDVLEGGEATEPLGQPGHLEGARGDRASAGTSGAVRVRRGRSPGIRSRNRRVRASIRSATPFWLRISTTSSRMPVASGRYCCQVEESSSAALVGPPDEVSVTRPSEASSEPSSGPNDVAGAADHGQDQHADRGARLEDAVVEDGAVAEAEEDAAEPGDAGREREAVELRLEDVDPDGGRRALVGAYGEQPSARAAAPQVRDRERGQDEEGDADDRVVAGVPDRVDRATRTASGPWAGRARSRCRRCC